MADSTRKSSAAASTSAKKTATTKKPAKKPVKKPANKSATSAQKPVKKPATSASGSTTATTLPVREDEAKWTKAELAEVLEDLNSHRDRINLLLADHEEELAGLMRDSGDGAGHDQADLGTTSFERDQELGVVNNEREMLAQIERALGRIEDGTYGICESCGNPIGKGRLMAFPRATKCMACKQREERR